jgi:ureidoglycolate lyase
VAERAVATRRLPLEPATAAAIAPFGALVGRGAGVPLVGVDYYAGAVAVSRPARFECDGPTELSLSVLRRRPFTVRYLERHFRHTQVFLPLGGKPWLAVLAPPTDSDLPDLDAARAFRFDGATGLCLHVGTWHEFPFPLADDADMIVLLSAQTTRDLAARAPNGIEAFGPDLDKKDITLRTGIVLAVELDT